MSDGGLSDTFGLLAPFFAMFALILAAFALREMLYPQRTETSTQRKPHKTPTANPFRPRESPLEMAGVISSPWKDPESAGWLEHSSFRGMYTLCFVLVLTSVLRMFYKNYGEYGTFIQNAHKLYAHFDAGPELMICLSMEYCFCHAALFLQVVYMKNTFSSGVYAAIQAILEAVLLCSGSVFTLSRPNWPFTQKIALMFQTIIFVFKFHSYCCINRSLSYSLSAQYCSRLVQQGAGQRFKHQSPQKN